MWSSNYDIYFISQNNICIFYVKNIFHCASLSDNVTASDAMSNVTLQLRHNEGDGVSNHRCPDCLLHRLLRRKSKKTSKLRVTGLCEGNPLVIGRFPSQRDSNAENDFI